MWLPEVKWKEGLKNQWNASTLFQKTHPAKAKWLDAVPMFPSPQGKVLASQSYNPELSKGEVDTLFQNKKALTTMLRLLMVGEKPTKDYLLWI
ncbi:hypothetical protein [Pedobacter frigiditerrae]|uniref:hypothetical protein n=1 Tax=Pedobacter frigiditerrae TaxID=2530452 RepID=UPI00292CDA59|nr:hypothetical protein [Pedobacter frigiditerrae]